MLAISLIIICLLIYRNEVISLFSAGELQMGNTMPKIPRKYKRMLSNMSNMPEWENSYPSNKLQMNADDLEENSNVPENNEGDNDSIGEIPSYERTQQVKCQLLRKKRIVNKLKERLLRKKVKKKYLPQMMNK